MKRIWSILLCLFVCVSAFAKSQVNVIFENNDNSKVEKLYKLETMPDGAQRLTIPVCDIERGTKKVSVISENYQANKGDEGYFIFPSLMGNKILFKHNNNKYHSGQLQMPFWGAKTPKGTYVAIAKGFVRDNFGRVAYRTRRQVYVNGAHQNQIRIVSVAQII